MATQTLNTPSVLTEPIAQPLTRAPLINRTLLLFMVGMVLANLGGNMYGPLLPLYLKSLDASVVQVGLFFTLIQIVPLALQILGGWISDSLGRLRSIALGSLAGMAAYVGLVLAPAWQWVLLAESFNAMCRSLIGPSFGAFIAEQSAEEHRARVFGITETIFMIVAVVGPPLGGWLADTYGFKIMLLAAASLYAVAVVIRFSMARAAGRRQESKIEPLTFAGLRSNLSVMFGLLLAGGVITWILVTDGVRDTAYALSFNLLPVYLQDLGGISIQQIGWLESLSGLAMMAVTIPAGWLADRKGERLGILIGYVLQFLALVVFLQVKSFWGFAIAWIMLGLAFGVMSPAYNSLISKAVPEKVRGTAFGLFSTSLGLVSLPAPAIGAQLWERVSPRFPFGITACISLLTLLPVWFKIRLPQRTSEKREMDA